MEREQCRGEDPLAVDSLAAETARGFDSKAKLPERLRRFDKARRHALSMSEHISKSELGVALRREVVELRECGSYLVFREYYDRDVVRLHSMRSCRIHLMCPSCAVRRGSRLMKAYEGRYRQLLSERSEFVGQMITLTVRDGVDLGDRVDHLRRCFQRLCKYKHLGRGSEWEKVLGSVFSYETKRGSGSGLWHPHVHIFALVDPKERVLQEGLVAEWRLITGDSFILDVHDVYGDSVEAFGEVFKYALKFADLSPADNLHAYRTLTGKRRLVDSTGLFRGVHVDPSMVDDMLDDETLGYVDVLWRHWETGYARVGPAYVSKGCGKRRSRREVDHPGLRQVCVGRAA